MNQIQFNTHTKDKAGVSVKVRSSSSFHNEVCIVSDLPFFKPFFYDNTKEQCKPNEAQ